MNTRQEAIGPHLTDGEMMRLFDGEGSADERARWQAHVDACATCAAELARVGDESRAVTHWLRRSDEGAGPDRRGRRPGGAVAPWLRAAAAILLLAAPVAAIPPARQWVADRLAGLRSEPEPASPSALAVPPATDGGSLVRFVPEPGPFTIRLDAFQAAGTLVLGRVPGDEAVLRLEHGAPESQVSAAGIRIHNAPASTETYRLQVPASVTEVVLRKGMWEEVVGGDAIDAGRVVPLTAGDRAAPDSSRGS